MRYLLLFLTFCFLANGAVFSQDKSGVQFGKVSAKDFELPQSKVINANANAVIIADIGSIDFVGNKRSYFDYVFRHKRRIKILNKNGFDLATLAITLYATKQDQDQLTEVDASTYNLEAGKIVQIKLDKKDIFETRLNNTHIEKKFTLPAIKEGSIIEYSYAINSGHIFYLPDWEFQTNDYPCLWSELNVEIPNLIIYAVSHRGYDSFYVDKSSVGHKTYTGSGMNVFTNTNIHRWVIKDVPALHISDNEKYISTARNYIDRIEFQAYQSSNSQDLSDLVRDWKTATDQLLGSSDFGGVVNQDCSWFDDKLEQIVGDKNDKLGTAKNIYYYIQHNFRCTNYHAYWANKSLIDIFNAKSGSVGEINMLLTALLREKKIPSEPVILSTRENGYNSSLYPMLDELNYLVCKANINGDIYYMDATRPLLGFGKLPGDCYNGYARVISDSHPDSVYFHTDSVQEIKNTSVIIINDSKGFPSGSLQSTPGYFESYDLRQTVKLKTEKEFFKNIQMGFGSDIEIENTGIDSLAKPEYPVTIHYDFNIRNGKNEDIFYFSPMLSEGYKENPLKAAERRFPVEMLYPINEMYVLNMEIPTGYAVEELPKSAKLAYNGNEGFFEYLIVKDDSNIQLQSHIKLNRANFSPYEYNALRDFFADIVKKQAEQIVFKKKK